MSDNEFEHLLVGDEVRAEGRVLSGTVMVYGTRPHTYRERFEPGSLELADAVGLNLGHDRSRILAWAPNGGLELSDEDDAMRMSAKLPALPFADKVLQDVRAGNRTGLSIEFRFIKSRVEGGIRIVEKALLRGIGIVTSPEYGDSRVEARARRRRVWL